MAGEIIPFGKYKGQDIDVVRQRDPQYLQWLTQQAWFQEKFAPVYQIVVNNFAPASEDTPAHNALQVRFLEHEFRCAFWDASGVTVNWVNLKAWWQRNTAHLRQAPKPFAYRRSLRQQHVDWKLERFTDHRDKVLEKWRWWREAREEPVCRLAIGEPKFETAFDVEFVVVARVCHPDGWFDSCTARTSHRLTIEIKPSMGDDYPAVLRQMKRQIAADQSSGSDYTYRFLLVDEFGSNSVTLDQVRAIFKADDITVLLVADVREQLIKSQRGSHG